MGVSLINLCSWSEECRDVAVLRLCDVLGVSREELIPGSTWEYSFWGSALRISWRQSLKQWVPSLRLGTS